MHKLNNKFNLIYKLSARQEMDNNANYIKYGVLPYEKIHLRGIVVNVWHEIIVLMVRETFVRSLIIKRVQTPASQVLLQSF